MTIIISISAPFHPVHPPFMSRHLMHINIQQADTNVCPQWYWANQRNYMEPGTICIQNTVGRDGYHVGGISRSSTYISTRFIFH